MYQPLSGPFIDIWAMLTVGNATAAPTTAASAAALILFILYSLGNKARYAREQPIGRPAPQSCTSARKGCFALSICPYVARTQRKRPGRSGIVSVTRQIRTR